MSTRYSLAFLSSWMMACGGGGMDSASSSTSSTSNATTEPGGEPTSTSGAPTTSGTSTGTEGSDSDSDGASSTTGTSTTSTGGVETTTTSGTSTTSTTTGDGTTAPIDPCDPDPCAAPQHCQDGQCLDPEPPGEGQVIVVEMMIDPQLSDFDAEWFELLNVSDDDLDLDGCHLADLGVNDDDHPIDAGGPLVLGPGERMVMAKTVDSAVNGGLEGVAYAFAQGFSLTNTGDAFILRCGDVDVDVVEFEPMTWPYDTGVAIQLDPGQEEALANDVPGAWCAATAEYFSLHTGSPGAANPPCR
ncbi:hypothetical protein [Nannocystis punicea]|uniref:LTD domain-containing protein n=1 Tax=Nannocystis punicea TaxID=2995304 RepID=A0ABY7HFK3_9BACT|nr:hypothetical protein [Nannocystis poenicansa]WAS98068.1 hypothetical protein O0S08_18165 [Nannocystis poenicansa]